MNIHEYQAKELLRGYGVAVLDGHVAWTPEEAEAAALTLPGPVYVVKSQIHAGGRGAGHFANDPAGKGGVRIAKSPADVKAAGELPPLPAVVAVGVPAELARRRPDTREALQGPGRRLGNTVMGDPRMLTAREDRRSRSSASKPRPASRVQAPRFSAAKPQLISLSSTAVT